jgi:heme oxygenase 2
MKFPPSALNNNEVWADGLTIFYEIFKFLEENVSNQILPEEYHKSSDFEKGEGFVRFDHFGDFQVFFVVDLKFFKGDNWEKSYKIRPEVQKYLNHLYDLHENSPLLLIAYVYHLYMGLLSGGQILAKKRKLSSKFTGKTSNPDEIEPGTNLTCFTGKSIVELKNKMRHNIDEYTKDFDENLRQDLIEESKRVFELNNEIIGSVEGVADQLKKNAVYVGGIALLVVLSFYLFMKMWKL